ncbi:target of Nesh-SH3 isoform X4 [Pygocentrus nattereri]|uniref:target of Nesh-SH3 isoform X4 n=1 Tax=Pygocentrus nattereri TaxID=42514 RepID=UPI0008144AC8|nr:target of Nesh-SH3 isoform X4 [Pygocentrus nattereri]
MRNFLHIFIIISEVLILNFICASTLRVQRENMKVRINATDDTIILKFMRPHMDAKLEGYILGYGSSMFSKQFIQLPKNGEPYETEIDAEPKYLIAVKQVKANEVKKHCTEKVTLEKPLHLVIGSVTPTSVLLSWGTLLKTPYTETDLDDCIEEGEFTVRYRENEPSKQWNYQTCPTTSTVIDNLKPDTPYEFGVRADIDTISGAWSPPVMHNTADVDIHKLLEEKPAENRVRPQEPIIKTPQAFLPPVPGRGILRNLSSSASVTCHSAHTVIRNGTARGCVPAVTKPHRMRVTPINRNNSLKRAKVHSGEEHKGLSMTKPSKQFLGPKRSRTAKKKGPNQVEKPIDKADKVTDLKQLEMDTLLSLKPHVAPATEVPDYQKPTPTSTLIFAFNGSRFDNSSVFSSVPVSDVDAMGKKRFVAPHVIYKTDKRPEEPCSVTHSLSFFPDEEVGDINVTGPPKNPPSNLTVVTVEGCSSFVILDWEKSDNETTEYEVTSSTKGPNGKEVSILTTNQTHTAVENLKPESSYEFTVTPKNELGSGPSSDPVTFSTESADPRVSEIPTGKNAIWSSFPFKADSYSECNGRQYVKRTWYRKFVGIQLCNSLRYKIYLSDSLKGKFYTIGDQTGYGEDHCQFVDSFLDGRTGGPLPPNQLPPTQGYFRAVRQEPVKFGLIGGSSHINYVAWYECGIPIPGSW